MYAIRRLCSNLQPYEDTYATGSTS